MVAAKKSKASDRTVGLFTGQTNEEVAKAAVEEVAPEAPREAFEGIEGELERYRAQAFQGQEWTTGVFYAGDAQKNQEAMSTSGYRLSLKGGWMYLEAVNRLDPKSSVYSYAGVMFAQSDLPHVAKACLKAYWHLDKEGVKAMFKEVCK